MSVTHRTIHGREILSAIGAGTVGFLLVAALLHLCLRDPLNLHADMRTEKLVVLRQSQGEAVSAAFGSSHVHNGFDPRVFDTALAGSSLQTRSINLGIAGGSQSEQRITALEYLAHLRPPTSTGPASDPRQAPEACLVLLEINAAPNFTSDHLVHPRAINIYDWQTARFELRLLDASAPISQRLKAMEFALVATGLHYANVGMLSNTIFRAPLDQGLLDAETIEDRRGLLVNPPSPAAIAQAQSEISSSPAHPAPAPQAILPGNRDLLEELHTASPVSHLQLVYFTMPRLSDLTSYPTLPDSIAYAGTFAPILNLSRPDLYPQLYNIKYWHDDTHLNEDGAALLTRLLAANLKTWYAKHGAPARCGA